MLQGSLDTSGDIRPVLDLQQLHLDRGAGNELVAYVIDDPQAINWRHSDEMSDGASEKLRHCGKVIDHLDPTNLGFGRSVISALRSVASALPSTLSGPILRATDPFFRVAPATVYAISRDCAREAVK